MRLLRPSTRWHQLDHRPTHHLVETYRSWIGSFLINALSVQLDILYLEEQKLGTETASSARPLSPLVKNQSVLSSLKLAAIF